MGTHYRRQDVISQYEHVFGSCPNSCRCVLPWAPRVARKRGRPRRDAPTVSSTTKCWILNSNWAAEKEETPVSVVGARETGALSAPGEVSWSSSRYRSGRSEGAQRPILKLDYKTSSNRCTGITRQILANNSSTSNGLSKKSSAPDA